jgi:hypothetical protein
VTCVDPDAVESAENAVEPLYSRVVPFAVNTVLETPDPHVNLSDATPQLPFEDFKVKPLPEAVAVMVAHVPLVYQVPAEMIHPFWLPPDTTLRYPLPLKVPPGEVGLDPGDELVEVGDEPPLLGLYLMPVLGQLDLVNDSAATNVPDWSEPRTL